MRAYLLLLCLLAFLVCHAEAKPTDSEDGAETEPGKISLWLYHKSCASIQGVLNDL
jgi:hypothetical protein